jgi:DnaK suppressor protein
MSSRTSGLEKSFVASQREKLLVARTALSFAIDREEGEDRLLSGATSGQANEPEDMAQDLTISENNRVLSSTLVERRISIDRALAKIAEGTYGISDISGEPIPLARLNAFPEAICTTGEQEILSARSRTAV